jgi:hypothetical protein
VKLFGGWGEEAGGDANAKGGGDPMGVIVVGGGGVKVEVGG